MDARKCGRVWSGKQATKQCGGIALAFKAPATTHLTTLTKVMIQILILCSFFATVFTNLPSKVIHLSGPATFANGFKLCGVPRAIPFLASTTLKKHEGTSNRPQHKLWGQQLTLSISLLSASRREFCLVVFLLSFFCFLLPSL